MYFVTVLYLYNYMQLIMLNVSKVSISMFYKTFLMQSHCQNLTDPQTNKIHRLKINMSILI